MYLGYPVELLPLLRCPFDSGLLGIRIAPSSTEPGYVQDGHLTCQSCQASFPISKGIVDLLDPTKLDRESIHEQQTRDDWAGIHEDHSTDDDYAIPTTLSFLQPHRGNLLELGCGTGRFTNLLASEYQGIVAVDFSGKSLRILANRMKESANVGLVRADIAQFQVEPKSFERVLSTLTSNLPTKEHRAAMFRLAATALTSSGRFVYSAHHYDLRRRRLNHPKEGHYSQSGIFRKRFTRSDLIGEAEPFFHSNRVVRRVICLPSFLGKMGTFTSVMNYFAERTPGVNQLSDLLVGISKKPVHIR